jgi:hypothetical protein
MAEAWLKHGLGRLADNSTFPCRVGGDPWQVPGRSNIQINIHQRCGGRLPAITGKPPPDRQHVCSNNSGDTRSATTAAGVGGPRQVAGCCRVPRRPRAVLTRGWHHSRVTRGARTLTAAPVVGVASGPVKGSKRLPCSRTWASQLGQQAATRQKGAEQQGPQQLWCTAMQGHGWLVCCVLKGETRWRGRPGRAGDQRVTRVAVW